MASPLIFYLWNTSASLPVNGGNTNQFTATPRMIGSNFLLTFIFLDVNNNPTDPANPSVRVTYPDQTILTATPLRLAQGSYVYLLTTPEIGNYFYTFSAL